MVWSPKFHFTRLLQFIADVKRFFTAHVINDILETYHYHRNNAILISNVLKSFLENTVLSSKYCLKNVLQTSRMQGGPYQVNLPIPPRSLIGGHNLGSCQSFKLWWPLMAGRTGRTGCGCCFSLNVQLHYCSRTCLDYAWHIQSETVPWIAA